MTGTSGADDSPGERLAPVTFLPGVDRQPAEEPRQAESRRPAGSFDRISNVSMYALARRGMSIADMRDYLESREFEPEAIDSELERLVGVGLLDDVDLARTLTLRLQERKGLGRSALVAELRRRRIDSIAIDEIVSELDSSDEGERAIELAIRRAPQLERLDPETARRRLGAFLMRKGYPGDIIQRALDAALPPRGTGPRSSGFSGRSPRSSGSSGGPVFR